MQMHIQNHYTQFSQEELESLILLKKQRIHSEFDRKWRRITLLRSICASALWWRIRVLCLGFYVFVFFTLFVLK